MQETDEKKYKSRHDWVGKVIQFGLYKGLNFVHVVKLYIHKAETVLED